MDQQLGGGKEFKEAGGRGGVRSLRMCSQPSSFPFPAGEATHHWPAGREHLGLCLHRVWKGTNGQVRLFFS